MSAPFEFIAGRLCLDFVNTVSERPIGPATREELNDYGRMLQWGRQAGILTARGAEELARLASAQPARARRVLSEALDLRERLHRLFRAIIEHRAPDRADLERFGVALAAVLA